MDSDFQTYLSLLERHLSLLRLLAQEFVASRKEFMAFDLDGIYRRIFEQEELCGQIQRLQPGIHSLQQKCATQLGLKTIGGTDLSPNREQGERVARILSEIESARTEVGRLNQIHAAYLRRSRRTANVLMQLVSSLALTYARPPESVSALPATLEKS